MNNVIIFGEVILKSDIHFDYLDKLKAYFKIRVVENGNVFDAIISEKYIKTDIFKSIYDKVILGKTICIR